MICRPCRAGADWLNNESAFPEDVEYARTMHAACVGATHCDCQHKVELQAAGKSGSR